MKKYPIQYKNKSEYIPFEIMLEHEQQCRINHGQSVEELARRHGTCYIETYYILTDSRYQHHNKDDIERAEDNARKIVHSLVYQWLMKNDKLN